MTSNANKRMRLPTKNNNLINSNFSPVSANEANYILLLHTVSNGMRQFSYLYVKVTSIKTNILLRTPNRKIMIQ